MHGFASPHIMLVGFTLGAETSTGCCMRPKKGQGLTLSNAIKDLVKALSSILVVMAAI